MSTSPSTPLEQVGDLSDNLRGVLESKMASGASLLLKAHSDAPNELTPWPPAARKGAPDPQPAHLARA